MLELDGTEHFEM